MERRWLRDRERVTSRDPVAMLLGLDVREDAASNARAGNAGMSLQAPPGHPARGRFLVSRQVSWLAGQRCSRVFPMRCRISDVKIGNNSLLTVAGAAPDSRALLAQPPASLLATMTCVMMDRDGYMWRYSPQSVNGASAHTHEIHNRRPGRRADDRRDGDAGADSGAAFRRDGKGVIGFADRPTSLQAQRSNPSRGTGIEWIASLRSQ